MTFLIQAQNGTDHPQYLKLVLVDDPEDATPVLYIDHADKLAITARWIMTNVDTKVVQPMSEGDDH